MQKKGRAGGLCFMTISFKPRSRSRELESTGNGSLKWSQLGSQKLSFGSLKWSHFEAYYLIVKYANSAVVSSALISDFAARE